MKTMHTRGWRAAVFLAILLLHALLLLLVMRAARWVSMPRGESQSLVILLLPNKILEIGPAVASPTRQSASRAPQREAPADNSIAIPPSGPAQPPIDWQHEAELAEQNSAAAIERDKNYRNLSGLSADQLKWIRENRMVPAPPGIEWTHPRFEFDSHSGLPIYWINDHCVLVMLMIFCGIGHIEPNGQLFKHMHDPVEN